MTEILAPGIEPAASPPLATPWVPLWPLAPVTPIDFPRARVKRSAVQSIPNTTWTMFQWTAEDYDNDGIHDVASLTNRLTCKTAGVYLWHLNVLWAASNTGGRQIQVQKNSEALPVADGSGLVIGGAQVPSSTSGTGPHQHAMSGVVALAVGDYITAMGYQAAGGPLDLLVDSRFGMAMLSQPYVSAPGSLVPVTYGTTLPSSPADGQEAILVDSVANPTYQWRFRYNAGSSSPYKWEFVGGAYAVAAPINAPEGTDVAYPAWTDLATVGPQIVVPRAGEYLAEVKAHSANTLATGFSMINACSTLTPEPDAGLTYAGGDVGNAAQALYTFVELVCSAGDTIKARYSALSGGTATFVRREMKVIPRRVA